MNGVVLPIVIGLAVGVGFIGLFLSHPIPSQYKGPGSDIEIGLQRTPCFGDCPVYSLLIYENGYVVFRQLGDPRLIAYSHMFGIDCTQELRPHVYQVPKDNVASLIDEFYRIDYFSLNDTYLVPITDLPTTITWISVNGTEKSVYNYLGGPPELFELERKIDEVALTKRWFENYDEVTINSLSEVFPQ